MDGRKQNESSTSLQLVRSVCVNCNQSDNNFRDLVTADNCVLAEIIRKKIEFLLLIILKKTTLACSWFACIMRTEITYSGWLMCIKMFILLKLVATCLLLSRTETCCTRIKFQPGRWKGPYKASYSEWQQFLSHLLKATLQKYLLVRTLSYFIFKLLTSEFIRY